MLNLLAGDIPGLTTLGQLVLLLGMAMLAAFAMTRIKVPTIVGYLLAGVIVGPGVLALTDTGRDSIEAIEVMAEVGVVFLLFTIGLKLSLKEIVQMKGIVLGLGSIQVCASIGLAALISLALGVSFAQGVFFGFLIAMSSTAVVLKLFEARGELSKAHGRIALGVLIFQDLAVVLLLLLIPQLAAANGAGTAVGEEGASLVGAMIAVGKSLAIVAAIVFAARVILPWGLEQMVRTRSREVFTIATMVAVLGTAWAAGINDISLPLGAFIARLVISESDYSRQILAEVTPLRDGLASLFFVSIGMLVLPGVWLEKLHIILLLAALVIGLKLAIVTAGALLFRYQWKVALAAGLALAQIGEFSFILASSGASPELGLLDPDGYQLFLGVSIISMLLTPVAIVLASRLAKGAPAQMEKGLEDLQGAHGGAGLHDHVVIVGYGINGRNVARVLRDLEVPYVVLELNPHTVRKERAQGVQIFYGDATRAEVLNCVDVALARAVVVALPDPASCESVVVTARDLNANAAILVRTRYMREVDHLHMLGATQVIPEEFETSLELAALVMETYGATRAAIDRKKEAIREEGYKLLLGRDPSTRTGEVQRQALESLLQEASVDNVEINSGSPADGRSLIELNLRDRLGVTLLAVERDGQSITNPAANFRLQSGDRAFFFGKAEDLSRCRADLGAASRSTVRIAATTMRERLDAEDLPE